MKARPRSVSQISRRECVLINAIIQYITQDVCVCVDERSWISPLRRLRCSNAPQRFGLSLYPSASSCSGSCCSAAYDSVVSREHFKAEGDVCSRGTLMIDLRGAPIVTIVVYNAPHTSSESAFLFNLSHLSHF